MFAPSFTGLTTFLLFPLLIPLTIHAASVATHSNPHDTLGQIVPSYAPPQPWDEELCQSALYPDVQLTVSFGDRMSATRIHIVLGSAKRITQSLVADGFGDHPIPSPPAGWVVGWDGSRWTIVYAQPYRKYPFSKNVFSCVQAAAAVGLLERCGVAVGRNEEMWAYVFARGKRVGDIWMEDEENHMVIGNGTLAEEV